MLHPVDELGIMQEIGQIGSIADLNLAIANSADVVRMSVLYLVTIHKKSFKCVWLWSVMHALVLK